MRSRRFATVVVLLIVVTFVVVAVAPAFASAPASLPFHARIVSSAPVDGATVDTAQQVVLTFNEDVNPDFVAVRVTGPEGSEVHGGPTVDRVAVTQGLATGLPTGQHTVTYRVVSADGHPVSGTVTFTTTAAPSPGSASPSVSSTPGASPAASATTSPEPTVTATPASDGSARRGATWAVAAVVTLLAVLGLGAARRFTGGRADSEGDAADAADGPTVAGPERSDSGRPPTD